MGKCFRLQGMDLTSAFFTEETAEYYPFLKGKAERWKIQEWYVIHSSCSSKCSSVELAEIRNRLLWTSDRTTLKGSKLISHPKCSYLQYFQRNVYNRRSQLLAKKASCQPLAQQNYFPLDFWVALWSINYIQNPEGIHKAPSIINN